MDDALVEAGARIEATIHQINGHWWNRRKRPDARDLRTLLDAVTDLRLAGVKEGLEMAAVCAEAYSAVNFETAGDSVLLDPVLRGHGFSPENMAASEKHQIDGLVHSSYAHAGQHLAASIRSLGPRP